MGGKKAKDKRQQQRDLIAQAVASVVIAHRIADHAHHLHDRLHPNEPARASHPVVAMAAKPTVDVDAAAAAGSPPTSGAASPKLAAAASPSGAAAHHNNIKVS